MFTRFWAILLVLICGFNAIGVSGTAYLSEKSHEVSSYFDSAQANPSFATDAVTCSNEDDCDIQHTDCHQCHLGHCNFLVTAAPKFAGPDVIHLPLNGTTVSYISIDLSGPRKPPRV